MAAIAAGDYQGAAGTDLAPAHELLGGLSLGALDDYERARRHLERSYRLYRGAGDLRGAARSAIVRAQVDLTSGNRPGARGWLARAARLIDEIGPCVEEGYYRIAVMGCEVPDVVELEANRGCAARSRRPGRGGARARPGRGRRRGAGRIGHLRAAGLAPAWIP
jgi:hypothetical protein